MDFEEYSTHIKVCQLLRKEPVGVYYDLFRHYNRFFDGISISVPKNYGDRLVFHRGNVVFFYVTPVFTDICPIVCGSMTKKISKVDLERFIGGMIRWYMGVDFPILYLTKKSYVMTDDNEMNIVV